MKTKTIAFSLLTLLSFNAIADDVVILPVISRPAVLEEGIQRQLSDAQIAELLPWAKNSKMFLTDLLDGIQNLNMEDKIQRLEIGIKQGVIESAPKNSELLMRYVLNRALVLNEILTKEMDSDAVGTIDVKLRVLTMSIDMALKYYESDVLTLAKKGSPNFASFGADYFIFLHEINKSIFDASSQFTVQQIALDWLKWDLYRDVNNASFAPKIVKINNSLKQIPTTKQTDAQYIRNIQYLKKIAFQLEILPARALNTASEQKTNFKYYNINQTPPSYTGGCYKISSTGVTMWEAGTVASSNCASSKYLYYNANKTPPSRVGGCYQLATDGTTMWEQGTVPTVHCESKYQY